MQHINVHYQRIPRRAPRKVGISKTEIPRMMIFSNSIPGMENKPPLLEDLQDNGRYVIQLLREGKAGDHMVCVLVFGV
jgi:hypothetical protein